MTGARIGPADLSIAAAQYESLRRAALGAELPPEARTGLLLFLRRGMWAWARALTARSTLQSATLSRSPNGKTQDQYTTVIHILAAMAIKITQKGATS